MFGLKMGELLILALALGSLVVPILFLLTWARTLRLTRTHQGTSPVLVLLMLVPVFNLGWQFYLLISATTGIKGRLTELGRDAGDGGFWLGVVYQSLISAPVLLSLVERSDERSLLGFLLLAALPVWIGYWVRIARFNRVMAAAASDAMRAAAVF